MDSEKSVFRPSCFMVKVFVLVYILISISGIRTVFADILINDGIISATIFTPEEEHNYTFTANIGDNIQIRMADISENAFAPSLQLYSPSGDIISLGTPTYGGSVAAIQYTADYTGTYTVLASDYNKVNTGSYNLYFAHMPGANEHGELVNDGVHQEQIDLGDLDTYTFTANSGDNIQIRMADTSENAFAPYLQLYSPSGDIISLGTPTYGGSVAAIQYTADYTGTYTVLASDYNKVNTGNYELSYQTDGDLVSFHSCISELCTSTLTATAHDPAGGVLSYSWTALDGGTIIGAGDTVDFDPPGLSLLPACLPYRVKLEVTSDVSGLMTERTVDITVKLAGDVNGDGVVNILDKVTVRNAFGQSGPKGWIPADVNCDGVVNILDKVTVRNQFGQNGCPCP